MADINFSVNFTVNSDYDAKKAAEMLFEELSKTLDKPRVSEEDRWAAIGRKPGEFKKGDIVGYKSDGELGVVVHVGEYGEAEVKTINHGICTESEDIELITPVEARFDRA